MDRMILRMPQNKDLQKNIFDALELIKRIVPGLAANGPVWGWTGTKFSLFQGRMLAEQLVQLDYEASKDKE